MAKPGFLGVRISRWRMLSGNSTALETLTSVPYWLIAIVTAPLPLWRGLARWRRRRWLKRAKANCLCLTCGYDLRASPERCPECGTPIRENTLPRPESLTT
jgi:uncharacterized paraquat-inducible protein A